MAYQNDSCGVELCLVDQQVSLTMGQYSRPIRQVALDLLRLSGHNGSLLNFGGTLGELNLFRFLLLRPSQRKAPIELTLRLFVDIGQCHPKEKSRGGVKHRTFGEMEIRKKYPVDIKAATRTPSSRASK